MVAGLDALMDNLQAAVQTLAAVMRNQDGRDERWARPGRAAGGIIVTTSSGDRAGW